MVANLVLTTLFTAMCIHSMLKIRRSARMSVNPLVKETVSSVRTVIELDYGSAVFSYIVAGCIVLSWLGRYAPLVPCAALALAPAGGRRWAKARMRAVSGIAGLRESDSLDESLGQIESVPPLPLWFDLLAAGACMVLGTILGAVLPGS